MMVATEASPKDATPLEQTSSPISTEHNIPPSDKYICKMVTTEESPKDATPLQQKPSPNSTGHTTPPSDKYICKVVTTEQSPKDAIPLQQKPSPNSVRYTTTLSDKHICKIVTTEEPPKDATPLLQKPSTNSTGHNTPPSDKYISKMETTLVAPKDAIPLQQKPSPNSTGHNTPPSDKYISKMVTTLVAPKDVIPLQQKPSLNSAGHNNPLSDKHISKMVTTFEAPKVAIPLQQIPSQNSAGHNTPLSDKEGTSHVVLEKPSEDGYNWRKYGQKNVKGNEFIRSYYKCSSLNCLVKKQIVRAHDGRILDTTYFGDHDHPKPPPSPNVALSSPVSTEVRMGDQNPAVVKDDLSKAHAPRTDNKVPRERDEVPAVSTSVESTHVVTPVSSGAKDVAIPLSSGAKDDSNHDQIQTPKRRKKVTDSGESVADKPSSESRLVVETVSAVDVVNDGYRWRKYGQKLVRGNPNPRSYYRCSTPGCPAKKQVERASHDPRVVITAYEGQHDHNIPPLQTVLPHNTATILSESTVGVKRKPEVQISPQRTPKSPEPTGIMPKTEEKINKHNMANSSDATTDAKPKLENQINSQKRLTLLDPTTVPKKEEETILLITPKSSEPTNVANKPETSNLLKTSALSEPINGAKTEQTEANQTQDSPHIPDQPKKENVTEKATEVDQTRAVSSIPEQPKKEIFQEETKVGETQNSASIPEQPREENVREKDDLPSNLEAQKLEQVKQEELRRPADSKVISSDSETQTKDRQKTGPEAVSC